MGSAAMDWRAWTAANASCAAFRAKVAGSRGGAPLLGVGSGRLPFPLSEGMEDADDVDPIERRLEDPGSLLVDSVVGRIGLASCRDDRSEEAADADDDATGPGMEDNEGKACDDMEDDEGGIAANGDCCLGTPCVLLTRG